VTAIVAVAISVGVFFFGLAFFKIISQSKQVISKVQETLGIINNPHISEKEKEVSVQRNSIRLLMHFGLIVLSCCSSLVLGFAVLAVFHFSNIANIDSSLDILTQWQTIVIITIVVSFAAIFLRFRKKSL
jgi:hypothetical protein